MSAPPSFEQWATEEIRRLRAQADTLEQSLHDYLRATGRTKAGVSGPLMASGPEGQNGRLVERSKALTRPSKYETLFARWAEVGEEGLTLDDMERIAREAGANIQRNALRSVVFAQKKVGRVRPVGDRYVWSKPPREQAAQSLL